MMATEGIKKYEKRYFRSFLLFFVILYFAFVNFYLKSSQYTLSCSKEEAVCQVVVENIFDEDNTETRDFDLADVQFLQLHSNDEQKYRLYLYVKEEPVPVETAWTNDNYQSRFDLIEKFNQFLRTDKTDKFFYREKMTFLFMRSLFLLVFFLIITAGFFVLYIRKKMEFLLVKSMKDNN